jgi:hypothetical protein
MVGYGYNLLFEKYRSNLNNMIPEPMLSYVKDGSRLAIKAGVGYGAAYAVGRMTKRPYIAKAMFLGTTIGVVLDLIATIAKYLIGYNNPFGKAVVMGAMTPRPSVRSLGYAALGVGEVMGTVQMAKMAKAAKSFGKTKILKGPKGDFAVYHPAAGLITKGSEAHAIGVFHGIVSSGYRGFGETITVEGGFPWGKGSDDVD